MLHSSHIISYVLAALQQSSTHVHETRYSETASHYLFERQNSTASTCGTPCALPGLPNLCCGQNTDCVVLAGNTTRLCCPTGNSCSTIEPIPCDIQLQNGTSHPENALVTTALTGTPPTCSDQCCPFGYTCTDTGACAEDQDQSIKPVTSSAIS